MISSLRLLAAAFCAGSLLAGCAEMALAAARVPLPRARPAEAPTAGRGAAEPAAGKAMPQLSACRLALTEDIAIAPSLPPINGPGACGGDDIVRLEAVVLADKRRVPLKPAATLRCQMATAVAEWVRGDGAAIAAEAGTAIGELDNFDSFACRGRNRVPGARLSEHGRANALDLRGVRLANGKFVSFTDRTVARRLREKILASLCARFNTVLGPGSDWYHEDHIHLDLAERRSGYRICHWAIWDPFPKVAPLLPAARPDGAPPRETAQGMAKRDGADESAGKPSKPAAPAQQNDKRSNRTGAGNAGAPR